MMGIDHVHNAHFFKSSLVILNITKFTGRGQTQSEAYNRNLRLHVQFFTSFLLFTFQFLLSFQFFNGFFEFLWFNVYRP